MSDTDPVNDKPSDASGAAPQQPQFGMGDQLAFQQYQKKNRLVLWSIFVLLLVLAAGVIFLLPRFVSTPDPSSAKVVVVKPEAADADAAPGLSPFEEAQRMRQRETAQNTLQGLLDLQDELEKQQVKEWAGEDFDAAIDFAHRGDDAYKQQQFIQANDLYKQGVDALQAIKDSEASQYDDLMQQGMDALADGKSAEADHAFSLALLIKPDSGEAVTGMERAKVLDDVLALLKQGRDAQDAGKLEEAQADYSKAQKLDDRNADVASALKEVAAAIEQRNFSSVMSRGYNALQNNDPEAAELAFNQAKKLRPNDREVDTALQQAEDQKTSREVNRHMSAAQSHEQAEDWQAALDEWKAVLEVDPNVVSAQQGQSRAQSRLNLDKFLQDLLASPLKLSDDKVYRQAREVIANTGRIAAPGPKLADQVARVSALLDKAKVPVTVQISSDGMTELTLLRVKTLGMLTDTSLQLLPGAYTLVGKREGYRDVRKEFTVTIGGDAPSISIACSEAI